MGRPSEFTQDKADAICLRLAEGESLRAICASDDMPSMSSVMRWLGSTEREEFREQYARAREEQADFYAAQIIEIADTTEIGETIKTKEDGSQEVQTGDMIQHRRLKVDARKWYASKLAPKKYGERIDNVISGTLGVKSITCTVVDPKA